MRNKRGQLFSLWIVILTLFLCGISVGLYNTQQEKVSVSLVSPLAVLELRDDLSVFEMRERELILDSLKSVSSNFGGEDFAEEFKTVFLLGLSGEMRGFLLKDLVLDTGDIKSWDENLENTFFENVVYREIEMDNGKLRFVRGKVKKSFLLESGDWNVVNFPVEFEFEFEKEYLISKRGSDYVMEEGEK